MSSSKHLQSYINYLTNKNYKFKKVVDDVHFPVLEVTKQNHPYIIKILDLQRHANNSILQNIVLNELEINGHLKQNVKDQDYKYLIIPNEVLCEENKNTFYIVMEKMDGTFDVLNQSLFINNCNKFLSKILKCLHCLHSYNVIHADIKPNNIFYKIENGNAIVKLGDFGASNLLTSTNPICTDFIPEEMQVKQGQMSDLRNMDFWQLGITMYTMFTGKKQTFHKQGKKTNYNNIYTTFSNIPNKHLSRFLLDCLNYNPSVQRSSQPCKHLYSYIDNKKRCCAQSSQNKVCKNNGNYFGYCKSHLHLFRT